MPRSQRPHIARARPRLTIGRLLRVTVGVALGLALLRGLGLDAGLPVLSSLIVGWIAFGVCRRDRAWAPRLFGLVYLGVPGASLMVGSGTRDLGWLVLGGVLCFPTILGAELGSQAAARRLPPGSSVAALDDLLLVVMLLYLSFILAVLAETSLILWLDAD